MSTTTAPTAPHQLGTILSIWAHPDDETYLAGGTMAAARDHGQRVVCVTMTAGEHGTDDPVAWPPDRLGAIRRWEAAAAMAALGVTDHRFLGGEDGTLDPDDAAAIERVGRLIDDVAPDTILTFGSDGMTFHPDHVAVHQWVTTAWARRGGPGRLLYATITADYLRRHRRDLESWGMYMTDERPVGVPDDAVAAHIRLTGAALDRKVTALRAMATQTGGLIGLLGLATYAEHVADEWFREATRPAPAGAGALTLGVRHQASGAR